MKDDLSAFVLSLLQEAPASGGALIERVQAARPALLQRRAASTYAQLARLVARGDVVLLAEGPGERVYGVAGARAQVPRPPGPPNTFGLGPKQLIQVDRVLHRVTRGLPEHFFHELRHAVVVAADRRVSEGMPASRATRDALVDLGPPSAVRRVLRAAARGRPAPLRPRLRARWIVLAAAILALVIVRVTVLGVHTVPTNSMAPTLMAADEGGDARILVNRLAYLFGSPQRGDVAVFRRRPADDLFVKRIAALPGEEVRLVGGDLFIDGERLLKERPLLDRMRVPLYGLEDFEELEEIPAGWNLKQPLHTGFRLPDGTIERGDLACREVVLRLVVRASSEPCTLTIRLEQGFTPPNTVTLGTDHGRIVVEGHVIHVMARDPKDEQHSLLRIRTDRSREIWITNADRSFRVEIDGVEVVRTPVRRYGTFLSVRLRWFDNPPILEQLEVARDLYHAGTEEARIWKLEPDEVFMLGDNSGQSRDSRHYGPVPVTALEGRVFAVVWPWSRLRWVR